MSTPRPKAPAAAVVISTPSASVYGNTEPGSPGEPAQTAQMTVSLSPDGVWPDGDYQGYITPNGGSPQGFYFALPWGNTASGIGQDIGTGNLDNVAAMASLVTWVNVTGFGMDASDNFDGSAVLTTQGAGAGFDILVSGSALDLGPLIANPNPAVGVDASPDVPPSGGLQETVLKGAQAGKTWKPLTVVYATGETGIPVEVRVSSKKAGVYTDLFTIDSPGGYSTSFMASMGGTPPENAQLVARIIGALPEGGTCTVFVCCQEIDA